MGSTKNVDYASNFWIIFDVNVNIIPKASAKNRLKTSGLMKPLFMSIGHVFLENWIDMIPWNFEKIASFCLHDFRIYLIAFNQQLIVHSPQSIKFFRRNYDT